MKISKPKKLFTLLIVLLISLYSSANHVSGSDLLIEQIDSSTYVVKTNVYQECYYNMNIGFPSLSYTISSGSTVVNRTLHSRSSKEVSLNCSASPSTCPPPNNSYDGGLLSYLLTDTIDFNLSTFSSLVNACILRFDISYGIRRSVYGQPGTSFSNFIEINRCLAPVNSTPILANPPTHIIPCNQPIKYNFGALDSVDHDSISYHWAPSLTTSGLTYSYPSIYAYDQPIKTYFPTGIQFPYNSPQSDPPIGLYLNNTTGDMVFVPTDCYEVIILCLRIKEWRKDSTGVYQVISESNRDNIVYVKTLPTNTIPTLETSTYFEVCEGQQLCFAVKSNDTSYTTIHNDSTTIAWDGGIPGANFSIQNPESKHQTGEFCWTPSVGSASSKPYSFTVIAKDNNCPKVGFVSQRIQIKVGTQHPSTLSTESLGCGRYGLSIASDSNASAGNSHFWQALDSNGLPLKATEAYFLSNRSTTSYRKNDSLKITYQGKVIIKHIIKSAAYCPTTLYDTLESSGSWNVSFASATDTICPQQHITLHPTITNPNASLSYKWKVGSIDVTNDSLSLDLIHEFNTAPIPYQIMVSDSNQCSDSSTITIYTLGSKKSELNDTFQTCYTALHLELDSSFSSIEWSDGSKGHSWTGNQSGTYSLRYMDSLGCAISDSFSIVIHPQTQHFLGNDTTVCDSISLLIPNDYNNLVWQDGDTSRARTFYSDQLVTLRITDTNQCYGLDSLRIGKFSKTAPEITFNQYCDSTVLYVLDYEEFLWSDGSTDNNTWIYGSGIYWVKVTDKNSCITTDTIDAEVKQSPETPTLTRIGDTLFSNYSGTHLWYRNDTLVFQGGPSFGINKIGTYQAIAIDSNGCTSDSSNRISKTAGIRSLTHELIRIYPNPAYRFFAIEGLSSSDISSIDILDYNGRRIKQFEVLMSNVYPIEDLLPGLYIVRIKHGNILHYIRLTK